MLPIFASTFLFLGMDASGAFFFLVGKGGCLSCAIPSGARGQPRQIHNYDSGVSSLCRRLEYGRERIVQKDTVHVHPFLLRFLWVYLCCAGAPVDEPSVLLVWNWAYPFLVTRRVTRAETMLDH